eukprot:SAG31_NODE_1563_length_7869_cov_6.990734_6_plen_157_part_00
MRKASLSCCPTESPIRWPSLCSCESRVESIFAAACRLSSAGCRSMDVQLLSVRNKDGSLGSSIPMLLRFRNILVLVSTCWCCYPLDKSASSRFASHQHRRDGMCQPTNPNAIRSCRTKIDGRGGTDRTSTRRQSHRRYFRHWCAGVLSSTWLSARR